MNELAHNELLDRKRAASTFDDRQNFGSSHMYVSHIVTTIFDHFDEEWMKILWFSSHQRKSGTQLMNSFPYDRFIFRCHFVLSSSFYIFRMMTLQHFADHNLHSEMWCISLWWITNQLIYEIRVHFVFVSQMNWNSLRTVGVTSDFHRRLKWVKFMWNGKKLVWRNLNE